MSSNKNKQILKYLGIAIVVIVLVSVAVNFTVLNSASNTPTPTVTPTSSSTPSVTNTAQPTALPSVSPSIKPSKTTSPTASPAPTPESKIITVVDLAGRTVTVPNNAKTVVAVHADTIRQASMLGTDAVDKIVGISSYFDTYASNMEDFLAYPQFLNTTKVARVGSQTEVDTDKIIVLQPDVIFISATYSTIADSIQEKTQIPVVCVAAWGNPNNNATLADFYRGLRLTGTILGMNTKAEEVIAYYQSQIDFVQARVASIPPSEQKTVYLANWATGPGTTYTTSKYWPVQAAGGINVAANLPVLFGEVSKEQILTWNPDIIFVHGFKHKAAATLVLNDTLLQDTTAVKNGDVYGLLGPYIGSDPKSWLVDMYITAITLYPNNFNDVNVIGKSHEIFQYVYGDNGPVVFDTMMKNRGIWVSNTITP